MTGTVDRQPISRTIGIRRERDGQAMKYAYVNADGYIRHYSLLRDTLYKWLGLVDFTENLSRYRPIPLPQDLPQVVELMDSVIQRESHA